TSLFPAPSTPELYTLSLHDALPIYLHRGERGQPETTEIRFGAAGEHHVGISPLQDPVGISQRLGGGRAGRGVGVVGALEPKLDRSEEHTSELQSRGHLVCRLLLEKK